MVVTKEMWVDWKNNPVTQKFLQSLLQNRSDRLNDIGEGSEMETNKLFVEIGRTQGIKDAFLLAVGDQLYVELEDGTDASSV